MKNMNEEYFLHWCMEWTIPSEPIYRCCRPHKSLARWSVRLRVSRHVGHSEHFSWALQGYHFWYSTAFLALIWPLILALSILSLSDRDNFNEFMRFFLSTFITWGWVKSAIWIDPMGNQSRQFIHFFSFNPYLKNTLKGIESLQH